MTEIKLHFDDYLLYKKSPIGDANPFCFVKKAKRKEDKKDVAIKVIKKQQTTEELNSILEEVILNLLTKRRNPSLNFHIKI
jgi:hypothetical protein